MSITLITAPSSLAVTLTEAKASLNVSFADDDTLITDMIEAATILAQTMTNRQLMTATYDYKIDGFSNEIKIPRAPLASITSVKYLDTDGVEQTLSSAVYDVDTDSVPGEIRLGYDQTWPSYRAVKQAIRIRFVCGYADSGASPAVPNDNIPEVAKRWILLQVGNMYEHREEYIAGAQFSRSKFADRLLMTLKVPDFA